MKKIALFISLLLIAIMLLPSCTEGIAVSNVSIEKDFYSVNIPEPVNVSGTVGNVPVVGLDGQVYPNNYADVETTCTIYKYVSPDQADPIGNPFYTDSHGPMTCPSSFNFSASWNYNPSLPAGTYYVVVISNGYNTDHTNIAFSLAYDMFVLWDSKQAVNGDVNAAVKKMRSAVKSIGNVQEQTQKYANAKNQGIITGTEAVNVQGQQMTADEAYQKVQSHLANANDHMTQANTLFNNQNYKLAFNEAQNAESEAQQGKQCAHVTSAQSGANPSSKKTQ